MNDDLKQKYQKRKINQDRLAALYKYGKGSILDVGCGNGNYVLELKDKMNIHGVDYQKFDSWNEAPDLFSVASADDLSIFPDNSFDTVCCFEVLEHMENPEKVLSELNRVCRQNAIITVPNCAITKGMKSSSFIYYHYTDRSHVQFFTRKTFESMFKRNNFKVGYSGFINKVSPLPVVKEYFGWEDKPPSHLGVKILEWSFKKFAKKDHFITLMVVARKINAQKQQPEQLSA